ncbi:carbohydrate esterase family 3 protein [Hypoxylon sp. FL1284]|nr:carbohydrate esterase family 3 protein [Hypoxylon sp. FL1284]
MLANKNLLLCLAACASQAIRGLALPVSEAPSDSEILSRDNLEARAKGFANGMTLRIMPLGASITYGYASTDKNGYRKILRDRLVDNGNPVNMVGDNPSGDMQDNNTEGWKSYTVSQVHDKANKAVPQSKPNLILVNAGTNDCIQDQDLPGAGDRVTDLVNDLFKESPETTVVLSTLVVNRDPAVQKRTVDFNGQLRKLVARFQLYGKRVVLVDMQGKNGPTVDDLVADGIHPNDDGYRKMAAVWFDGIKDADTRHFLQPPEKVQGLSDA